MFGADLQGGTRLSYRLRFPDWLNIVVSLFVLDVRNQTNTAPHEFMNNFALSVGNIHGSERPSLECLKKFGSILKFQIKTPAEDH